MKSFREFVENYTGVDYVGDAAENILKVAAQGPAAISKVTEDMMGTFRLIGKSGVREVLERISAKITDENLLGQIEEILEDIIGTLPEISAAKGVDPDYDKKLNKLYGGEEGLRW